MDLSKHEKKELKRKEREEQRLTEKKAREGEAKSRAMKKLAYISVGIIVVLAAFYFMFSASSSRVSKLDPFAQCLTEKNAVMYGVDWCSNCQQQKRYFGSAFKNVRYIECEKDRVSCLEAGISAYPTWIFDDGTKIIGLQDLENLAQYSGCELEN